jgi:hypothetical protein
MLASSSMILGLKNFVMYEELLEALPPTWWLVEVGGETYKTQAGVGLPLFFQHESLLSSKHLELVHKQKG